MLLKTFEFVVPLHWKSREGQAPDAPPVPLDYLTPDGDSSTEAGDAVRFSFRLWPTMRETAQIEQRQHELNGGRDNTSTLEQELEAARNTLRDAAATALLAGRQASELTPEERTALFAQVDAYAMRAPGLARPRALLLRLAEVHARHAMAAAWPVLGISLPKGWADISEVPLSPAVLSAILQAYTTARDEALDASGKTQPSPR